MDIRKAHTAEHIFMKALYSFNETVRVIKVIHRSNISHVFVKADRLGWNDILNAAKVANMIIMENRRVFIEEYPSFEEALKKYPELRAYEERITPPIRVVIIEGYDYAACKMPHVNYTGECIMFLPISYRKEKKKYVIDFLVGEQAIEKSLDDQELINEMMDKLQIDSKRILNKIQKLLSENRDSARRIRKLTRTIFEYSPAIKNRYEAKIIRGEGMDMRIIGELSEEWVKEEDRLVVAIDKREDDKFDLLITSSKNIDLSAVSKDIFDRFMGRGGGRRNWIMGYVKYGDELLQYILDKIDIS